MRGLLYRAIAGLFGCTPGLVQSDATGKLSAVDAAAGRAALNACANDDPRLSATSIPAGIIAMWSGTLATIPSGWALCDGQAGRPDLRNRFIKGAATDPGAMGGSATHQHFYSDVINHTHPVTVNDPGHSHLTQRYPTATGGSSGFTVDTSMSGTLADNSLPTKSATTGITAGTANPAGGVAQGTTTSASSEPPYFVLAFIIKL